MPYEAAHAAAVNNLLAQVGRLAPTALDRVAKQHVVSQVLLERFTEQTKGGNQLYPFDVEHPDRVHKLKGTAGVAWELDFVPFASRSLEQHVWGTVEQVVQPVFTALDTGNIFADPKHSEVLRDLLAMHLARSHTYRDLHVQTFPTSYAATLRSLTGERSQEVRAAVLREKGLHVVGRGGLEHYARQFLEPSVDLFTSGALFRVRVEEVYTQIRKRIASSGVRVYNPQGKGEFLIGDAPAFTFRRGPGRPVVGVPLDRASTVVLPLGPRHLLALAQRNDLVPAPLPVVAWANVMQILLARRQVYLRPGSGLQDLVRQVCDRRREHSNS